jgi:hypothetical protein
MRSTINIHLGADARIAAPEQADGFLEISAEYDTLNLFLGFDDETRVSNIDKIAKALLDIRIRCLTRMVQEPDPIDQAKAAGTASTLDGALRGWE